MKAIGLRGAAIVAALGLAAAQPAAAQVFYSVTGTFQADTDNDDIQEIYDWAFAFETATYIASLSNVIPTSCSITGTFYACGATQTIDPQGVLAGGPVTDPFIGFNVQNVDLSGGGTSNYFFAPNAFGADGVYTTTGYPNPSGPIPDPDGGEPYFVGNAGFATLTVRSAAIGAVPEPATWGLMIAGFGAIGTAMRRSARRATLTVA